jgi:polyphenol oxidase
MQELPTISPVWPAPKHVRAIVTTRVGGYSNPPYGSLNLGDHVGDDSSVVSRNRALVRAALRLPSEPAWLQQVHGTEVVDAGTVGSPVLADGAYTNRSGVVCAVLTADCLPIFLCDSDGAEVALLHGGWRGLAAGIVEAGVTKFSAPASRILAWLGPAIGPKVFEVGDEVRATFLRWHASSKAAFVKNARDRWFADIYLLARLRLEALGIAMIYGGEFCTVAQSELFYSYRRDGVTGRMASLIWMD